MDLASILEQLKNLSQSELDSILDERDKRTFEIEWIAANDLVPGNETLPDEETIFKALSDASKHHEICSYLIDDLNLIYRADLHGIENDFIDYLKSCYAQGRIPKR